jgi:hypothetical protein
VRTACRRPWHRARSRFVHASIYDAVNGIVRTHEPYFVPGTVPASASADAAAIAAAHRALVALFPTAQADFTGLRDITLAQVPDGRHKWVGVEWGEAVASRILAWQAVDDSEAVIAAPSANDPGSWVPTPPSLASYLLPQWGFVMPFVIPTGAHFRPTGPPALDSTEYVDDYNEVKTLGAAIDSPRTAEQDEIALFWADGAATETPPRHWNTIAQGVAEARGNTLAENARLFALLNVALADAAIAAWDAKYHFHSWRPVTAIRNGDMDGNPATIGDPTWSSLHCDAALSRLCFGAQHVQRDGLSRARPVLRQRLDRIHDGLRLHADGHAGVLQLLGSRARGGREPTLRWDSRSFGKRGRPGAGH